MKTVLHTPCLAKIILPKPEHVNERFKFTIILRQGPSWSGRDYGGHWKLLMYSVRRFFSPVFVSGVYNATQADGLSVYITNDQPWTVEGEILLFIIRLFILLPSMQIAFQVHVIFVSFASARALAFLALSERLATVLRDPYLTQIST